MSRYGTAPPPPEGQGFKPSEHVGSLVRFFVTDYDPQADTPWDVRPQALVDVDVIAGSRQVGERFEGILLSGVLLARQLGNCVGEHVYGRLAAQPGKNANPAVFLHTQLSDEDIRILDEWHAGKGGGADPGDRRRVSTVEYVQPERQQHLYNQHPPKQMPPAYPPPRGGGGPSEEVPF